jgi:hypothetical protein
MEKKYIGCSSRFLAMGMAFSFLGFSTVAHAAARLDKTLFEGLSFLEESVKRIAIEGKIESELGSQALADGRIEILGKIVDDVSSTTKAQYFYKDLEVIGAMALSHQTGVSLQTEQFITPLSLNVQPRLSARQAFLIAKPIAGDNSMRVPPTLKILPNLDRTDASLVYVIDFASKAMSPGSEVYVDANSGRVIAHIPHRETIAPITIYNSDKKKVFIQQMVQPDSVTGLPKVVGCLTLDPATGAKGGGKGVSCDTIVSTAEKEKTICEFLDPRGVDPKNISAFPLLSLPSGCETQVENSVWKATAKNEAAARAFENSTKVAAYYLNVHGRDSYDNKGSPMVSFVNAGLKMNNAFWDSEMNEMTYGAGDGVEMDNFTKAIDVAGHEMTHGVVSKTAALLMMDENGALNEAFADFFGKLIEGKDQWRMGVGLNLKDPNDAIRDLADPHSLKAIRLDATGKPVETVAPAHVKEKFTSFGKPCDQSNDRCFVHDNSTIPSHAMYRMVKAIGKEMAEKIVYQTLTKKLTPRSNFRDTSAAMKSTCRTLFNSTICKQVDAAWLAVGL